MRPFQESDFVNGRSNESHAALKVPARGSAAPVQVQPSSTLADAGPAG